MALPSKMRVGGSQDGLLGLFLPFQNGIKKKIKFGIDFYRFWIDFGTLLEAKLGPKIDQKWYQKMIQK